MSKIAIIGDLHSDLEGLLELSKEDITSIICVGDLGIFKDKTSAYHDGKAIKHSQKEIFDIIHLIENNQFPKISKPLYTIKGNHDDYENMYSKFFKEHNIHYLQQGEILQMDNLRIGTLGGIYSPVRTFKDPEKLQGREKRFFTTSELNELKHQDYDILMTHQAATNVMPRNGRREEGSELIEELLIESQPEYYIHGHHHHNYTTKYNTTKVIGLGNFSKNKNSKIYFNTKTIEII
jgi:Icc-related predicted phosphoesterase